MTANDNDNMPCKKPDPSDEHKWLQKLVGSWTCEGECNMGPDKPAEKMSGHETIRALGDFWIVAEGEMSAPGGGEVGQTRMTLGYDPNKKRFTGNWVGSMMTNMWVYEGELDAAKKVLPLNTVGPDFVVEGKEANYQDIIEIIDDDNRILRSQVEGPDGKWMPIMSSHYKRKK